MASAGVCNLCRFVFQYDEGDEDTNRAVAMRMAEEHGKLCGGRLDETCDHPTGVHIGIPGVTMCPDCLTVNNPQATKEQQAEIDRQS